MKTLIIAAAIALSACSSAQVKPTQNPVFIIVPGATTWADVEKQLGQPYRLVYDFDGSYKAIYMTAANGEPRTPHVYKFDRAGHLVEYVTGPTALATRIASAATKSRGL